MVHFYRYASYSLVLFLLSGCGFGPRAHMDHYRPLDENGEPISNAFTIAADYCMYVGLALVIGGVLAIVFMKWLQRGGMAIIAGMALFVFAQFFNFIGAHMGIFTASFFVIVGLLCFLYYKAITTSIPWLEKLANKDFNNDGWIGTSQTARPIPRDIVAEEQEALEQVDPNELLTNPEAEG